MAATAIAATAAAAAADSTKATKQEQQQEQEREHARNQAELGILNPSGRTSADPLGARRAGVAGAPGGRGGWVFLWFVVAVRMI